MQSCHAYVASAESQALLEQVLVAQPQLKYQVQQQGLTQARQRYQHETSPDLLILDLSAAKDADEALQQLLALADVCAAGTQVLALGLIQQVAFFKQLLAMGVRDYVPLPVSITELQAHIAPLLKGDVVAQTSSLHTRQMVVAGLTGGVGSSTVAAQLARLLSEELGMHLGLVDLNPLAGALDLYLGQQANSGFAQLLSANQAVDQLLIERAGQKLSERLTLFKTISHDGWLDQAAIERALQRLSPWFSALLWDLPSHQCYEPAGQTLLRQADDVLWVGSASVAGVRDIQRSLSLLGEGAGNCHWLINAARGPGSVLPEELLRHTGLSVERVSWLAFDKGLHQAQELGKVPPAGRFMRSLRQAVQAWSGQPLKGRFDFLRRAKVAR